jgi:hypothetical protein
MLHNNGRQKTVLTLKVPRQYPHILLVKVYLREGKALGSEGGKGVGGGRCLENNREFEHGLYCL